MSKTSRPVKTNAARLLDRLGLPYELLTVPVDESDLSAVTVAGRLGADPACVFKTLVARGDRTGILMACIPAAAELDLKALAAASGNKHVEMVHLKEVFPLTGYIRGGCSPLAAKKAYPVFVDGSAAQHEYLCQRRPAGCPAPPCSGGPAAGGPRGAGPPLPGPGLSPVSLLTRMQKRRCGSLTHRRSFFFADGRYAVASPFAFCNGKRS